MKRRSGAAGTVSKARGRKTETPKRRVTRKARLPQGSSVASREPDIAQVIRERDEALEQQIATSEVLQIISSSPDDLQPVFTAMLVKAVRICDAKFGGLYRWDGEALHQLASHNTPPAFASDRRLSAYRPYPNSPVARMVANKTLVHVRDIKAEEVYIEQRDPVAVAAVALGGIRTFLGVPLLHKSEMIGAFFLNRQEVRPFTGKQIELVKNLRGWRAASHRTAPRSSRCDHTQSAKRKIGYWSNARY